MSDLAIYDMDRTVTRRATYTPFLLHCALRRAPWRLLLLPLVALSMLAYVAKLIDRGRLKEINHRLLLGTTIHPAMLKPLVDSFADGDGRAATSAPARALRSRATRRRAGAWSWPPPATASTPTPSPSGSGFDDCIGTDSIIGLDERVRARIDGENCYGPAKLRMIRPGSSAAGLERAATSASIPTMPATRRCSNGPTSRSR